jgi:hypothetical protein
MQTKQIQISQIQSGEGEGDQAGAKQHKTGNGHSEETVGSEFFTHGTPPFARRCWFRFDERANLLQQNDCHLAQSKGFPSKRPFRPGVMISCNTHSRPQTPEETP